MPTPGLEEIIESAVEDVTLPDEPDFRTAPDEPTEVVEEAPSTPVEATEEPAQAAPSDEVESPAIREASPAQDDFEKRFGIPQNSVTGRENRIPYSRVKKITEKAEKDTDTRIRAEYAPKLTEFEAKVKGYEEKLSAYETRLKEVATFENILDKNPEQFLGMLVQHPQYQRILAPLFHQQEPAQTQQPQAQAPAVDADMPQPDQKLSDGTSVYSMEGLSKLNAWNRAQAAKEARESTLAEVEKKFGPIYNEWEQHQRVQAVLPKVQAQIEQARKWPKFNENEPAIIQALQADRNISLEAAYRQVVMPQFEQAQQAATVDRTQLEKDIRAQILKELKQAPTGTSTQAGTTKPSNKPFVPASDGDDKLTSIIRASIRG